MRTKPIAKSVKVTVDIQAIQGTAYQRALKRKFFARLISECWRELKAESEAKRE